MAHHISCHGVNVTCVARSDERNHAVGPSSAAFISLEMFIPARTHTEKGRKKNITQVSQVSEVSNCNIALFIDMTTPPTPPPLHPHLDLRVAVSSLYSDCLLALVLYLNAQMRVVSIFCVTLP